MADLQKSTNAVVSVLFVRNYCGQEEILLQRRKGTPYMCNMYDFAASGKINGGERATVAGAREVAEEICVEVNPEDLEFIHLYQDIEEGRLKICFLAKSYCGTPEIGEPDKCGELSWFPINALPSDIIPYVKIVIQHWKNGIQISSSDGSYTKTAHYIPKALY